MKPLFLVRWLLGGLVVCVGSVTALSALTAEEAAAFVHDYYAVYNAPGVPKMMEFYSAEATLTDPTFGLDLKSRDEISALLTKGLAKYESLEMHCDHTVVAGDDLVVEGTLVGRVMDKDVRVRFTSVFQFKDGKISAQRDMFDTLHLYAQLGIVPAAFRPKPAEANPQSN